MKRTALVLEGGGMRGVFTSGVLEAFMEHDLYFDDVYAVSAGASTAISYMAGQKGRNKRVFIDYINDPRYKGVKSLLKTGAYFNKEFIFDTIPNQLDPLDYDAFFRSDVNLFVPLTNCNTGEVEYMNDLDTKQSMREILDAATSLPVLSKPVEHRGNLYYDGGVACPLVLDEVLKKDYDKIVYVLTQPKGFRKKASEHSWIYPMALRKFPKIRAMLNVRHITYNTLLERIEHLEKQGELIIARPGTHFKVTRTGGELQDMRDGYDEGLALGEAIYQMHFR